MLLIDCPYCQAERAEIEFSYAGEAHLEAPAPASDARDKELEAFLFFRSNPRGLVFERWVHVHGCGRHFNAVRNSVSDRFVMTYKASQPRPGKSEIEQALK